MNTDILYFAKVRPDAIIPTKNEEDAGYDLYANFPQECIYIESGQTVMIPTGIATAFSDDYVFILKERGSTGTKGMSQMAGVIDSGYRGEIVAPITNLGKRDIIISKLSREEHIHKYGLYYSDCLFYPYSKAIAQGILFKLPKLNTEEISYDELSKIPSLRGVGKLGSSGK